MKYRNRLQIVHDILSVISRAKEAKKTTIMYGANLSYMSLQRYLTGMLMAGFIGKTGSLYYVTEKGRMFLEVYKDYNEGMLRSMLQSDMRERKKVLEGLLSNFPARGRM
jgi:predicted transcriptional regulator